MAELSTQTSHPPMMKSRKPRFPRITSAEDIAWMDARMSKYPVNLFSAYGVRCNTRDDISHWRRWANEMMPEAACQLGLAYLDGNGTAVDIAEAKRWLGVGADRHHPFSCFKLAELTYHELTSKGHPPTHECLKALDEIYGQAKAGVGEACVSLHFILTAHGRHLQALGWDIAAAAELKDCFLETLRAAYRYRQAASPEALLEGLRRLAESGSGHAFYCAGRFLEDLGRKDEALQQFTAGARKQGHGGCLTKALDLAKGEAHRQLIDWAGKHLPTPDFHFRQCFGAMLSLARHEDGAAQQLAYHAEAALADSMADERFDAAHGLTLFLIDLELLNLSPEARQMAEHVLAELRRLAPWVDLPELSMHLLGKMLRRQNEAIDARCVQQGHPPITQSREAFGARIGMPLSNAGLSLEDLVEIECANINEHALLMRGVIRGDADACDYLGRWTWNQQFCTSRVRSPGIARVNPVTCLAYDFAKIFETRTGETSPMRSHLEEDIPEELRSEQDPNATEEATRLMGVQSRETLYRVLGRACRPSLRLVADILAGQSTSKETYRPWHAEAGGNQPEDLIAKLWTQPLLARCPIHSQWRLTDDPGVEPSADAADIARLTKSGDYQAAYLRLVGGMHFSASNFGANFKFDIGRPGDDHELLSIMVREMMTRGDYASAEPIVDYLLYARLLLRPCGLPHHLSAWIKYHLGRLSDALVMLEDCTFALESESLGDERLNVDLVEYKLLHVELLLRAQRLDAADHTLRSLAAFCEKAGVRDQRLATLRKQLEDIRRTTTLQYADPNQPALARTHFDPDIALNANVLVGPHLASNDFMSLTRGSGAPPEFTRLSLSNMDRYRCLFPANN
jgi:hypothetical protein